MDSAIIIGAGISGLTCARILKNFGLSVTILDKSRGVGGRMATRRSESVIDSTKEALFDHGAQFFTIRDQRFSDFVEKWQSIEIVKEWCRGFFPNAEDGHPRYIGKNGMTSAPKYLSADLNILLNSKVKSISNIAAKWSVLTEAGEKFTADAVILSPPIPQSLQILDNGGVKLPETIRSDLESITYEPCIAILVEIDGPSNLPDPGGIKINDSIVRWVCDNHKKGISAEVNTITIHSSAEFASDYWDSNSDDIARILLNEISELIGSTVLKTQVHKWRYTTPINTYKNTFLVGIENAPLIFCGDAFGGPRVEGAFISGLETAEHLIRMTKDI